MQRTLRPSHRQPATPQQLAICVQPSTELEGGVCLQGCLRWCLGASWGGLLHEPECISTPQKKDHTSRPHMGCSCTCRLRDSYTEGIPSSRSNGKLDYMQKGLSQDKGPQALQINAGVVWSYQGRICMRSSSPLQPAHHPTEHPQKPLHPRRMAPHVSRQSWSACTVYGNQTSLMAYKACS